MRFHEIINPAFPESFSCLSHCDVRNPHPLYNLGWSWTSPFEILNIEICSIFPIDSLHFMFRIKILIFWEKRIDSGPIFYMSQSFFGQKNLSLFSWEIIKKSFCWKWLKIFLFSTLWIWLFGIFDKNRPAAQGSNEVKNSRDLLQGPRLMAWTTKSPIRGNHWVPLGCRALLGSVKQFLCNSSMTNFVLKSAP